MQSPFRIWAGLCLFLDLNRQFHAGVHCALYLYSARFIEAYGRSVTWHLHFRREAEPRRSGVYIVDDLIVIFEDDLIASLYYDLRLRKLFVFLQHYVLFRPGRDHG
jgi:hypothetical protein